MAIDRIDAHIGARIRARRRRLGLSQADVAASIGVQPQQVQKYETGVSRVTASRIYLIGQCLGVPAGHFFDGMDAPAPHNVEPVEEGAENKVLDEVTAAFFKLGSSFLRLFSYTAIIIILLLLLF